MESLNTAAVATPALPVMETLGRADTENRTTASQTTADKPARLARMVPAVVLPAQIC
jgi:hypothetical protein